MPASLLIVLTLVLNDCGLYYFIARRHENQQQYGDDKVDSKQ